MIRKAFISDLTNIMEILEQVKEEMHQYNNYQWDENYPQDKDFIKDIEDECLYVSERDGKFAGFICVNNIEPKEYEGLNWSLHKNALVVHRMAVNPNLRRMGIGTELLNFAEDLAFKNNISYLKTDTYSTNEKMNLMFKKFGFEYVNEMQFLGKEKSFNCYEKVMKTKNK